jgi:hypothetical protein
VGEFLDFNGAKKGLGLAAKNQSGRIVERKIGPYWYPLNPGLVHIALN